MSSFKKGSVGSLLASVKGKDEERLLTDDQINQLVEIPLSSNSKSKMLDKEHKYFLYEIGWMLREVGFDRVYNFLNVDWTKVFGEEGRGKNEGLRKKILFENPLLSRTRERFNNDVDLFKDKVEVEAGEPCKRCKSENTIAVTKQTKCLDEMSSIHITCLQCGFKWWAQ